MAKMRLGIVIYKEQDESGTYYLAIEPLSGAQVQGDTIEEAVEKIKEEIVKMGSAWCESELKEAVDARIIEVELPEE
ncbi:hypothetical protein IPA_00815 [Ignicoccus pacificus DSM 13166]|uniref:Type II toxin-antitoxin system HicB family antitoxin n=1 Tax=Ignicoccus pacificus DSM 13166 TaxID=940294 RepID=A0A977K8Y0_9CREN|nr:hypothetical protein IPA_00815 [Ignicoccus pacificus DSM 13166]